ncbi:MAG: DUF91 domain-containing protein [Alphaproteobacteria bacterium GM202ARS2]|nr:DUF91 domain-containing protein [Alphaproteobacteria bacterium GM202ARS2]
MASKTARDLLWEFAEKELTPGKTFSPRDAVVWVERHYPKRYKSSTIQLHVAGMATNNAGHRQHHPHIRPDTAEKWNLFYKIDSSHYRLYDPKTDPSPVYGKDADDEGGINGDIEETDVDNVEAERFAFERDLQNYIAKNLDKIEKGLRLYEDEDGSYNGIEYPAGKKRIDILAVATNGDFVVIETKVSKSYDRVIGQILNYIGWVKKNLADNKQNVRGVIVAHEIMEDLRNAVESVGHVKLVEYKISFQLQTIKN